MNNTPNPSRVLLARLHSPLFFQFITVSSVTPNSPASSLIKIVDKLPQVCILYM